MHTHSCLTHLFNIQLLIKMITNIIFYIIQMQAKAKPLRRRSPSKPVRLMKNPDDNERTRLAFVWLAICHRIFNKRRYTTKLCDPSFNPSVQNILFVPSIFMSVYLKLFLFTFRKLDKKWLIVIHLRVTTAGLPFINKIKLLLGITIIILKGVNLRWLYCLPMFRLYCKRILIIDAHAFQYYISISKHLKKLILT